MIIFSKNPFDSTIQSCLATRTSELYNPMLKNITARNAKVQMTNYLF